MNNMPVVTKNLLIINVLVYMAGVVLKRKLGLDLNDLGGLHFFLSSDFRIYQPVTYMFLHGGELHVFFNMFAVWMFGRVFEQIWGSKRYLLYYMVCGIGAALCQEFVLFLEFRSLASVMPPEAVDLVLREGASILQQHMNYTDAQLANLNLAVNLPTVGASGAVFGILLAFGLFFPNERMFIFPIPFPIQTKYLVVGYAILEFLWGVADRPGDSVAHFAHLGGMLFGLLLIMYWRKKEKNGSYYY